MNIYTIKDDKAARNVSQLLKLNAECARLHWSRTITDIPVNVMNALGIIEEYVEAKVGEVCDARIEELNDEEEALIVQFIKKNPTLQSSLGIGLVMSGDQADELMKLVKREKGLDKIKTAIESGKNIVIF